MLQLYRSFERIWNNFTLYANVATKALQPFVGKGPDKKKIIVDKLNYLKFREDILKYISKTTIHKINCGVGLKK